MTNLAWHPSQEISLNLNLLKGLSGGPGVGPFGSARRPPPSHTPYPPFSEPALSSDLHPEYAVRGFAARADHRSGSYAWRDACSEMNAILIRRSPSDVSLQRTSSVVSWLFSGSCFFSLSLEKSVVRSLVRARSIVMAGPPKTEGDHSGGVGELSGTFTHSSAPFFTVSPCTTTSSSRCWTTRTSTRVSIRASSLEYPARIAMLQYPWQCLIVPRPASSSGAPVPLSISNLSRRF